MHFPDPIAAHQIKPPRYTGIWPDGTPPQAQKSRMQTRRCTRPTPRPRSAPQPQNGLPALSAQRGLAAKANGSLIHFFYRRIAQSAILARLTAFAERDLFHSIYHTGLNIMAYTATTAINFAQRQVGRYGDGECWTLIEDAVTGAGGKSSRLLTPNFSATSSYVWGTLGHLASLQAGDVLQFSRYTWDRSITISVANPDGSSSEDTQTSQEVRGVPQHSALVVRVISPGIVEVVEQNIPRYSGPVQTIELVLIAPAPETVTTRTPSGTGFVETTTTTTHRVSNPPRCYRPISA